MNNSENTSILSGQYRVNPETCNRCGLCHEICPCGVIASNDKGVWFREDRLDLCMKCGQCMCICPTSSILAAGFSYEKDLIPLPESEMEDQGFFRLIATRRSIRNFKAKPVPEELLKKITEAISYAPPGFTPVKTEIIVVRDAAVIRKALPFMVELYELLLEMMKNPVSRIFIRKETGKKKFQQMKSHMVPLMESRMPGLKSGTEDTITRNAQAMILFHADQSGEDLRDDAAIAATYCMLAAHSMGLGATIMGLIPPAINKKKELRELFQLPDGHEVLSSVILGYPKYRYARAIKRNLKSITWI